MTPSHVCFYTLYILARVFLSVFVLDGVVMAHPPLGSGGPPIIPLELIGEPKLYLGGWCSYASDTIGVRCLCVCFYCACVFKGCYGE